MVPEEHVKQVPVTTTRMVSETMTKQVPETICETVTSEHVKQVPVTTCRMVSETAYKTVPYTVCTMQPRHLDPVQVPVTVTKMCPKTMCRQEAVHGHRRWSRRLP